MTPLPFLHAVGLKEECKQRYRALTELLFIRVMEPRGTGGDRF